MARRDSITLTSALILKSIQEGASYGFEVMELTGLASGTVYPALRRLEAAGLIDSQWEAEQDEALGPPRRHYQLRRQGTDRLIDAQKRFPVLEGKQR